MTAPSTPPAQFIGSFPDPAVVLSPILPEIALIGRSNVGKSSLLNALVEKPGFARVSATPGKTTLLNVFQLPYCYLIDLPGYGFARASKTAREGYRRLITTYLTRRQTLAGVVWLLDIRHPPSKDDLAMQALLAESHRPVLPVLTKADKLGRHAQRVRAQAVAESLGLPEDQIHLTSVKSGLGIADLQASIAAAAQQAATR